MDLRSYPELVIVSRGALLNESPIVGGYVSVVGILLQHIDLQFNFLLFILDTEKNTQFKERLVV